MGSPNPPYRETYMSSYGYYLCDGLFASYMEKITHLNTGKIGELIGKAEFIKYGFDVYSTEVDDKGIDFIVCNKKREYFEIQVKTTNKNYMFMRKDVFQPKDNLYLLLIILEENTKPIFNLIPSFEWLKDDKPIFLKDRLYTDKKSKPEYGILINDKYIPQIIEKYSFEKVIGKLF